MGGQTHVNGDNTSRGICVSVGFLFNRQVLCSFMFGYGTSLLAADVNYPGWPKSV